MKIKLMNRLVAVGLMATVIMPIASSALTMSSLASAVHLSTKFCTFFHCF